MVKKVMKKINSCDEDKKLVKEAKKNNQVAISKIYNKYYNRVITHLKIKSNNNQFLNDIIEEFANDAFITLVENIKNDKYEERGELKAYLQLIAFRKLLRHLGKEKYHQRNLTNVSDSNNEEELYDILNENVIDYGKIAEESLKGLNEICLQLIVLKYYDKINDTDIYEIFSEELKSVHF